MSADIRRSINRRTALSKAAELQKVAAGAGSGSGLSPAQVAAYSGMLGGGALAGDAAMNGEQSALKRVGKGAAGVGLAYLGHKALTDPRWQQGINNGVSKAITYIRGLLGKSAEAAYIEGFCKAAEAAGVDPAALVKMAKLNPGNAYKLVSRALRGERGSELGGKILAAGSYLGGIGRMSARTRDNLQHMSRLDRALRDLAVTGYDASRSGSSLPDLVRAAHLDIPGTAATARSSAVERLLKEMGYAV